MKSSEAARFVLLYDDNDIDGYYDCLFADSHVGSMKVEDLKVELK